MFRLLGNRHKRLTSRRSDINDTMGRVRRGMLRDRFRQVDMKGEVTV
jgi:hypothetical protein